MEEEFLIQAKTVARRCSVKSPNYDSLTSLDWIVLDLVDGVRSFADLKSLIDAEKNALETAYLHLRKLGFLVWSHTPESGEFGSVHFPNERIVCDDLLKKAQKNTRELNTVQGASQAKHDQISCADIPQNTCLEYLPARLLLDFKQFNPSMLDESLDIPVEKQMFIEFIHSRLNDLSHFDLLGLTEGACTKADAKTAYVTRTKQFHPDRFFRKNTGRYSSMISAIFKAVTVAFTTLQAKL